VLIQGDPKSKPLPNYQTMCKIVLKSANEIRFFVKLRKNDQAL